MMVIIKTNSYKIFRTEKQKPEMFLDGRKLVQVGPYKYHGSYIKSDGRCTSDPKNRIAQERGAHFLRKGLFWCSETCPCKPGRNS